MAENSSEAQDIARSWWAAMQRGDWESAWQATDRVEIPRRSRALPTGLAANASQNSGQLVWDGRCFSHHRVLIRCTHGLGDTLQFARYFPLVAEQASALTVLAQPALVPLLQECPNFGEIRNAWTRDPTPPHDVEIECMELAYAFRSTAAMVPARVPYIAAPKLEDFPALHDLLSAFPSPGPRKVGLVWGASLWDASRSIPVEKLAALSSVDDSIFFNLQQGPQAIEGQTAPLSLVPLATETTEVRAAAAALQSLDLVITVDTFMAHLAGALGRPVWLLLQDRADWRWQASGSRSPWYPTMRIFRQPSPGDWDGVIAEVALALAQEFEPRTDFPAGRALLSRAQIAAS